LRVFPLILIAGIVAEIWVFIEAGEVFGAFPVILAVIAAMFIGAAVIRRQGIRTLNSLRGALNGGSPQEINAADGALVYLAGILLILPGFLSDLAAIALLVKPVRRFLIDRLSRRVTVREAYVWPESKTPRQAPVIEGEVIDITAKPGSDKNSPWQA